MTTPATATLLDLLLKNLPVPVSGFHIDDSQFRLAASASINAIWDADLVNETVWWNEAFDRLLEARPLDTATSWVWWTDRIHPDDRDEVVSSIYAALDGEAGEWAAEYRAKRADGAWAYIADRARIIRDSEGRAVRIVGIALDVTEWREAEQRLQIQYDTARVLSESGSLEEASRSLVRSIGERLHWSWGGFWAVDKDAGVLRCVEHWHQAGPNMDSFADFSRTLTFAPGDVLAGRVWQERRPLWTTDAAERADFRRAPYAAAAGLHCYVAFPVISGGEVLGVMEFAGRDYREPNEYLLEAMRAIGAQLGQAVQRWQAAEDLRRSEARFRVLAESMPQLVWIAGDDGRITYYNSRAFQYQGLDANEAGTAGQAAIHPDDLEATQAAWRNARDTDGLYEFEHRLLMKDGSYRWHLSRAQRVDIPSGARWYGTSTDIEAVKEAEKALMESDDRFRTLFNSIDEGYCLCEMLFDAEGKPADFRFLEINNRFSEMTGIQPGAEGKMARSLIPGLEDWWVETYGAVVLTRQAARFQQGSSALGRYFDVYVTPVGSRAGARFAIVFSDITVRHNAELALKESEERFRVLADNISQFAWMADESGSIFWYNQRWYDYTGTTLEQVQGFGWTRVHHPDHVDRVVQSMQEAWKSGEPWEDTFPLRGKDGEYRWFLSRARPIRDENGKIVRWFGTNTDVTEQRETAEALRIANGHKDQFLGLVSHELRTPVATIITNAWLLQAQGNALPPEIREQSYSDILSEAHRLQDTIENLLLLTRAETSGATNFEVLDLPELIHSRIKEFDRRHPSRTVQFTCECAEAPISGQSSLLAMVFDNLLSNADKYSPPDAEIDVSLLPVGDGEFELHVADRGIGIPEAELGSMFTPFHRTQEAQKYATGMGLGLAVCKRIVEAHGGRIWVEPRDGGGSDFAFAIGRYVDSG